MQKNPRLPHSRRPPAHLSVCLRHDGPPRSPGRTAAQALSSKRLPREEQPLPVAVSPIRKASDESNNLEESSGNWFDPSNERPEINLGQGFVDSQLSPLNPTSSYLAGLLINILCKMNPRTSFASKTAQLPPTLYTNQAHVCTQASPKAMVILFLEFRIQPLRAARTTFGV